VESQLSQGRHVIMVGDMNIRSTAIDSYFAEDVATPASAEAAASRRWWSDLVSPTGPFFDAARAYRPDSTMFTRVSVLPRVVSSSSMTQ
jgi:exonuclease III